MDARFPDRWLNDRRIARLPDDAFRLFVLALAWSVSNLSDGVLYDDDLPLIPGAQPLLAPVLERAGLWARGTGYWVIENYADTQTTAEQFKAAEAARVAKRAADAQRKRRQRSREAQSRMTSRVTSASDTQDRTGQDRTGSTKGESPTTRGTGVTCVACDRPARRACSTCWEHASMEVRAES